MSARVSVRELRADDHAAWHRVVAASPEGSVYANPDYLEALCAAAGGQYRLLGVFKGEELLGGLPLYERADRAGRFVGPRLLLYYLSPVIRASESKYPSQRTSRQVEVLSGLAEAVEGLGFDRVMLKCRHTLADVRPFLARGWRAWPSYSYQVEIADLAAAHGRMEQNLRRLVERAAGQGIRFAEDDDFASFYRLHQQTLDRKDAAAYLPEPGFRTFFLLLRAAGLCRLYQARLPDGRSVAAQLVLTGAHPVSHTVSAAADPEFLSMGVNAFLRWKSFEALSGLGFTANDLTDAALNPVTHFKSQLGGDLVTCFVLESPTTVRWRTVAGATALGTSLRKAAGRAVRSIAGRRA